MSEETEHYTRVREFMRLAGQVTPDAPSEEAMTVEVRILRARLILEEALETITYGLGVNVSANFPEAMLRDVDDAGYDFEIARPPDIVLLADGCADLSVVTTGTFVAAGIKDKRLLELVDMNNLEKIAKGHKGPDGKWTKPKDHEPPDVRNELLQQGWRGER